MSELFKGKKKFCAIEFPDKSHSVLPRKWLFLKKHKIRAYWPDNSVSRSIVCEPDENWPTVTVSKIIAESCEY